MKKAITTLILLIAIIVSVSSQEIEIIYQKPDYQFEKKPDEFYYISNQLDSTIGKRIADLKFVAMKQGSNNISKEKKGNFLAFSL